ncbi:MAG: c-type cytochrome [Spirosomataceae bacterium]|jgi:cytochrome c553|nr:c-type cytochrome [Bacteroidota bacterium]
MKNTKSYIAIVFSLIAGLSLVSCNSHDDTGWEFAPNMYNSRAYEPLTQINSNSINPGGLNMRKPVAGTIARRKFNTKFTQEDGSVVEDLMVYDFGKDDLALAANVKNPIPWSEQAEEEGKVLYERNCMHCHGEKGAGDGKVAAKYKGVPNYSSDALKNVSAGHIFHVITFGKGRMWPHAAQVTPIERWKIAHYVARLQIGG